MIVTANLGADSERYDQRDCLDPCHLRLLANLMRVLERRKLTCTTNLGMRLVSASVSRIPFQNSSMSVKPELRRG